MNRMVRDGLLFVLLPLALLGGMTGWMLLATKPGCGNIPLQQLPSPDGRYKAVLFERSCPDDTAVTSHLSVLVATGQLPDGGGNLFSAQGRAAELAFQLQWQAQEQGRQQLLLSSPAAVKVLRADPVWSVSDTVTADYQFGGPNGG